MAQPRTLITAALPYANGPVHIGHLAGCHLPADIYARYCRAAGKDALFVCGSDEHGVPITIRAMKEGTAPQAVVDKYHEQIKASFAGMDISFDIYSRTSTQTHRETAQAFFKKLYDEGIFTEQTTEQFYDEEAGVFLADRYIVGTCPVCGNPGAYGDQCERCGSTLSPDALINPHSALSTATPVKRTTRHWYFPLDRYEAWLRDWIVDGKKDVWKANVWGQCKSWIDGGLQPRAMTRDGSWGVPVPVEGADGKVLYVWFDAPIGYISATKELTPLWADYWQSSDTKLVHFLGKDNIVFHCIIFPAMLKAHGGFVLPEAVPANEFLNIEGQKVSTSRNWAVWVDDYLRDFPCGQDMLRYVLCAGAPETKDNDFTWREFGARVNGELVANLGNFVNRAFVLMHKLCGGRVPHFHAEVGDDADRALEASVQGSKAAITDALEGYRFRDALAGVMELSSAGNRYLQDKAPWHLVKNQDDPERQAKIDNCIHHCLQLCANLAILIGPFLPSTARKLLHQMKVVERMLQWENAGRMDLLKAGYPLRAPELLFQKVEDETLTAQVEKLHAAASSAQATPGNLQPAAGDKHPSMENLSTLGPLPIQPQGNPEQKNEPESQPPNGEALAESKSEISIDDFAKVQLLVGTVAAAERIPKADKLLQLTVDMGTETRTILSGIAEHFSPEEVVGRQVTVVANLAPRKMRGIMSQGMILMSEDASGKLVFVSPAEAVSPGSTVR